MSVASNIETILSELPTGVKLVTITKTKPADMIMQAYAAGQHCFGENKVQELVQKYELLPKNIEWHLVGHLQTNKVKYIAPFIHMIHSVDSMALLCEINKQALKNDRIIHCLLQVHIAKEETKFGLSDQELFDLTGSPELASLKNITIAGLMGMATYTENESVVREEFKHLYALLHQLKNTTFADQPHFKELSMGMSSDYRIATQEGSTIVRVGSKIFGKREYPKVNIQ